MTVILFQLPVCLKFEQVVSYASSNATVMPNLIGQVLDIVFFCWALSVMIEMTRQVASCYHCEWLEAGMNLNTGDALKTFCFKALALRDNMKDLRVTCSFPQCLRIDWTSHFRFSHQLP